jgi:antibiotic biosynthesis monooxygenase (ABM) superfamily enzyme
MIKESDMTVKIVIKRKVPKNKEKELLPLIKELRIATTRQAGYISGETLQRIDKPGETVVVSTWEGVEDWNRWLTSPDRAILQQKIDTLLGQETEYEIYSHSS